MSVGLLICTLISENQGLEKSRSGSNLRKISGRANLNFFLDKSDAIKIKVNTIVITLNSLHQTLLDPPPHIIVICTVVFGQVIRLRLNNFAQIMNQEVKNEESSSVVYLEGVHILC